ncbi:MAG: hypothetical protein BLM47_01520 [Candidatus Reconcilbacillus cellulovorans]|uniref:Uncharacterized protein n=1 Tax=Candidatus Reconcilbacillus cellulovorans TaxID=1906605 RepID=A0A2A6E3F0_9BACL|nr:MAG: hypothetical protein BLM47_01520 [Candidatus Reconcilbacillus cellulovorans]
MVVFIFDSILIKIFNFFGYIREGNKARFIGFYRRNYILIMSYFNMGTIWIRFFYNIWSLMVFINPNF